MSTKAEGRKGKKSKNRDAEAGKLSRAKPSVAAETGAQPRRLSKRHYEKAMAAFQIELVRLQKWIVQQGLRIVLLFEGGDAAGKGGAIKRITQSLNPRACRVIALRVHAHLPRI